MTPADLVAASGGDPLIQWAAQGMRPDVRAWAQAGITEERLVAVAAEAWSVPEIGFLAGVATRPQARGRGLAASVCAFVTNELLAGRQRVALVADYWNSAAIATYRRLGFTLRPLGAARQRRS